MITKLSDQLRKEFPEVLIVDRLNEDSSFSLFGFEITNGWYGILHHAFSQMQLRIKDHQAIVRVRQVKEKYGTLRLYIQTNDNECNRIADQAEDKSETACEICGAKGELNSSGWWQVRCESHFEVGNIEMSEAQINALIAQLTFKH